LITDNNKKKPKYFSSILYYFEHIDPPLIKPRSINPIQQLKKEREFKFWVLFPFKKNQKLKSASLDRSSF
ncbi:hypothetical protein, partial [Serratia marcescens]|uniref:hypothetical protein n=1 Tax=Serratia marcescens TaxID=615 RepID=UPI0028132A95